MKAPRNIAARRIAAGAILALLCLAGAARAQEGMTRIGEEDHLTSGEISAVRDAQQPDKRLILYMDFAQRRIDTVKQTLASGKTNAGRAIQKSLVEYIRVLEDLESTLEDARQRRAPMEKAIKDIELRGAQFLAYLESLNPDSTPGWGDFEYTIEEAIDMTKDELAEVARGAFPEIQERTPPRELPGLPSSRQPARSTPLPADGPPRKSDAPADRPPAEPSEEEEGPPRKSQQRNPSQ
jgi:hypothetical protein